jgi:foldase protein PrsA
VKNIKKLISAALISMVAISAAGCNMIAKTPEAIAKSPVAVVNGETITRGELDNNPQMMGVIAQAKQQYGADYSQNTDAMSYIKTQKEQILDTMITEKIVEQKAKEMKLLPDASKLKNETAQRISDIKKQSFGGDENKFQQALKQQNLTEQSLNDMMLSQIKSQEIYTNISNSLTKDVKIDDKQVTDYYNANKTQFAEKPDKIHLAHILVATEAEAKKIEEDLAKGGNFAKLAEEFSTDPGSKSKGGDLGTVPYVNSGFDATFMAAALALKPGTISAPVKTQFGYHIIKCISKQEYPIKSLASVKEQIRTQLEDKEKQSLVKQKIDEWKKAAKITKYDNNLI